MLKQATRIQKRLTQWRRTIHQNPELGFDVYGTAELVANTLSEMGIKTQTGVGKTGVVGYLGEVDGPVIAIRADMDALPITEANDVSYSSNISGKMHACGHDAHTAILIGAAQLLSQEILPGQVRFIFQPSEEVADEAGISGAPRMIEDGVMENVAAIIALHVDGTLDTGFICCEDGFVGAAADTFRADIIGNGGHGAYPHEVIDAIWLTNLVLNTLYAIPSRQVNPLQPNVVSVGVIRGGTTDNVIPESVHIEGTLRSYDDQVRHKLIEEVERALKLTQTLGGDYKLEIERGYPAQYNHPEVAGWLRKVGGDLLGSPRVCKDQRTMGAEDFSYMSRLAKGAMFRLGVKKPASDPRYLHTSTFDIDESALPIGAAILAETAKRYLEGKLVAS